LQRTSTSLRSALAAEAVIRWADETRSGNLLCDDQTATHMHDVIDIDGSFFTGSEGSPHLWRFLTPDGRFLAVVTRGISSTFRAHVFHRVSGAPQWRGTWWMEIDHPSLTDSLDSAENLARERLNSLANSPVA